VWAARAQDAGQGALRAFSQELLEAEARKALLAVGEDRGVELWGKVPVRFASHAELEATMRAANAKYFHKFAGTRGYTERDVQADARLTLALFSLTGKEILVSSENFASRARSQGSDWYLQPEALRIHLVHEAAHAADDLQWNIGEGMASAEDFEAIQMRRSVTEGHAQLTTHRVSRAKGWEREFDRMIEHMSRLPPLTASLHRLLPAARLRTSLDAYLDGEWFMSRVFKAGGYEAVKRALYVPRKENEFLSKPEWFLDPSSRPSTLLELESGLDHVASRFDSRGWEKLRWFLGPWELGKGIDAPEEELERWIEGLVRSRALSIRPRNLEENRALGATLFEHTSAQHATETVALKLADSRRKDSSPTGHSLVRILDATYETVERKSCRGFASQKRMSCLNLELEIAHVVLTSGRAEIELMSWGGVMSKPALLELAETALGMCKGPEDEGE
jgi:hypothetical protein